MTPDTRARSGRSSGSYGSFPTLLGVPSGPSPTARALRALEVLQSRPGVTADELAARLGVTERAARRYVAILREAGIPVDSIRGPHGGYRLGRGARLPPVVFTEAEALAVVMAVLDGQPSAADPADPVGVALGKVIRALPERVGRQAAALREHASAAPDRYSARPDPTTTSALVAAVALGRRVRLTYRSETGNEWEEEVEPWAVVVRYGRWYLLCHSSRAEAIRTYRVDRIGAVHHSVCGFTPPEGLDPVAALEENLGLGGSSRPASSSRPQRPRWRRGSGPAWAGSNRWGTGAFCPAARATRRCTRRSGWRACRSRSVSTVGQKSGQRSPTSPHGSLPPW